MSSLDMGLFIRYIFYTIFVEFLKKTDFVLKDTDVYVMFKVLRLSGRILLVNGFVIRKVQIRVEPMAPFCSKTL